MTLEFAEAVFGVQHELTVRLPQTCATCAGTGARPGTTPITCSVCHGAGEVRRVRQSILGQMVTATPCPRCGGIGRGDPLARAPTAGARAGAGRSGPSSSTCPAGVDDGSTLRLPGRGAGGLRGGPAGDLYVHLRVRDHTDPHPDGGRPAGRAARGHDPGRPRRQRCRSRPSTASRS